ncbi:hypothetical protein AB4Y86_06180 [Arthrobacter sp. 2YAF22_2]|uniref:hypothetical protein n=1 Tax=Arthrobacter sp. 2YAF22_2 TaxID=3233029 RepID=UPI003F932F2D
MKTFGIRTILMASLAGLLFGRSGSPGTRDRGPTRGQDLGERGDVPGWVMITLMSAVLVAALLALAGPALEGLFNQAMQKVGQ